MGKPIAVKRHRLPLLCGSAGIATAILLFAIGCTTSFGASAHRLVGPGVVTPGSSYVFRATGFTPGMRLYVTVTPKPCKQGTSVCQLSPCPGCAAVRVRSDGSATFRFVWPKKSFAAVGGMGGSFFAWKPNSRASVYVDSASTSVPRGCIRLPSTTANPKAGTVICAQASVRISAS
jgi:hypothetical protein